MTDNDITDEPHGVPVDDAPDQAIDDAADGLGEGPGDGPDDNDPSDDSVGDPAPGDLGRPQKRLLKRLYNARTVPVIVDDRPFLTYRDALRYLLSLPLDARDSAYAAMKARSRDKAR